MEEGSTGTLPVALCAGACVLLWLNVSMATASIRPPLHGSVPPWALETTFLPLSLALGGLLMPQYPLVSLADLPAL